MQHYFLIINLQHVDVIDKKNKQDISTLQALLLKHMSGNSGRLISVYCL